MLVPQASAQDSRESFEERGYALIRGAFESGELDDLRAEILALGKRIVGGGFSLEDGGGMSARQQSLVYDRLKYVPALSRLSGSKRIMSLSAAFGLESPALMGCCNMRLDRPSDERHLFAWHQDTLYLLGSQNAVTFWIPLDDVNERNGTIQVARGSHKAGLRRFKRVSDKAIFQYVPFLQRDLALDEEVDEPVDTIVAQRGDLVIFKQMLLHRSLSNASQKIRWTAQIRVTDIADPDYAAQHFPTGDRTNVFYVRYPGYVSPDARYA